MCTCASHLSSGLFSFFLCALLFLYQVVHARSSKPSERQNNPVRNVSNAPTFICNDSGIISPSTSSQHSNKHRNTRERLHHTHSPQKNFRQQNSNTGGALVRAPGRCVVTLPPPFTNVSRLLSLKETHQKVEAPVTGHVQVRPRSNHKPRHVRASQL